MREVSVDESIVAFKGRSNMIVYKPNKPHKWGLNAWVLSEAKIGYVWNMEMYTGKKAETEVGMTKKGCYQFVSTTVRYQSSCLYGQLLFFTRFVS